VRALKGQQQHTGKRCGQGAEGSGKGAGAGFLLQQPWQGATSERAAACGDRLAGKQHHPGGTSSARPQKSTRDRGKLVII
jgi:hypothetical protein